MLEKEVLLTPDVPLYDGGVKKVTSFDYQNFPNTNHFH
jgi:hypothetical protein